MPKRDALDLFLGSTDVVGEGLSLAGVDAVRRAELVDTYVDGTVRRLDKFLRVGGRTGPDNDGTSQTDAILGVGLGYRWFDLFHRHLSTDTVVPLRHRRNGDIRPRRPALIEWFKQANFSLTEKFFVGGKTPRSLILVSKETLIDSPPGCLTVCIGTALGVVTSALEDCGWRPEKNAGMKLLSEVRRRKDKDLMCASRGLLLRLGMDPTDPRSIEGCVRYLVFAAIYENDAIDGGFFYYYCPCLVRKGILTGTVAAFAVRAGGTVPVPASTLVRVEAVMNRWARFLHEAEVERTLLESSRKAVAAAIMSRNLSHNIGSHVLADTDLVGGLVKAHMVPEAASAAGAQLGQFHQYLQSRMDFIAKAISGRPEPGEPMFFRKELVGGFMGQSLLLKHLVKDTGYGPGKIEVHVKLARPAQGGNGEQQPYWTSTWTWTEPDGPFVEGGNVDPAAPTGASGQSSDPLVGIPGGRVGCHAFYAIIENTVRNACKYGDGGRGTAGQKRKLVLTVRLEDHGGWYEVVLTENLSVRKAHGPGDVKPEKCECCVCKVRRSLRDVLAKSTEGVGEISSHGIFEIVECARLLAGPNAPDYLDQPRDGSTDRPTEVNLRYRSPVDVVGWPTNGDVAPQQLAHRFRMQKPRLLGLLGFASPDRPAQEEARGHGVLFLNGLEEALEEPCQILVVNDRQPAVEGSAGASGAGDPAPASPPGGKGRTSSCGPAGFAQQHTALPYRTIVVTDRQDAWRKALADAQLHPKRFRIVGTQTHDAGPSLGKTEPHLKRRDWPETVIQAYEWWITLFKGEELSQTKSEKWNLVIGFDREVGELSKWAGQLDALKSGIVDVAVCCVRGDAALVTATAGLKLENSRLDAASITAHPGACVWFDNHGNALGNERLGLESMANKQDELAAYHEFGAKNLSLHQLLEHPPADPFALRYLILGLLEAALTKVFVLDERVAEATVRNLEGIPDFPNALLTDMNRSRVFPLYTVRREPDGGRGPCCLSPTVQDAWRYKNAYRHEGVSFVDDGEAGVKATLCAKRVGIDRKVEDIGACDADRSDADVLVVHEGVVDRLDKEELWDAGYADALYGAVPAVVRTSGRGSEPRHLPKMMSFLEFSEVSWATYQNMNKYLLAKPLLGSVAGRADETEAR